ASWEQCMQTVSGIGGWCYHNYWPEPVTRPAVPRRHARGWAVQVTSGLYGRRLQAPGRDGCFTKGEGRRGKDDKTEPRHAGARGRGAGRTPSRRGGALLAVVLPVRRH